MKPYVMSNIDGRNACLVAARTISEAAKKMRISVYHMRQLGWHPGSAEDAKVALAEPDTVFYRPIGEDKYPWSPLRYERDYDAGPRGYRVMESRR